MGDLLDLRARRGPKSKPAAAKVSSGRVVICTHCGEKHPIIRLASGEERYVTAFSDAGYWFCRNRGCRAAWLAKHDS